MLKALTLTLLLTCTMSRTVNIGKTSLLFQMSFDSTWAKLKVLTLPRL